MVALSHSILCAQRLKLRSQGGSTPGRNLDGFRSGKNRVRQAENSNFFRAPPERFKKQGSFRYGRARGAAAKNRCLQRTPRFATGTMGLDQDSAHNLKFWSNSSHIPSHILEILVQLVPPGKVTKALIMGFASLWFALLEGRKLYELRRHAVDIPCGGLRVLLVCSKAVRKRFGLSCRMAEGMCYTRLGPFTADQIIKSPYLRGGVLASDDEIRKLLPANAGRQARGYLYRIVGVKMSKAKWGDCFGNGSNCLGFFDQYCGDQTRWTEQ